MKKINMEFKELPYSIEESLNKLRVNIKYSGESIKKVMVTSSIPNEGKSFVAVQLWKMLAEAGFKTVYVDLDLRKSFTKTRYNIDVSEQLKGINDYLSGLAEYEEVLYETNVDNAYIVPCLTSVKNPVSLIEDPRCDKLFENLEDFDYVIVDTPPMINVSDGSVIAPKCDGAIMVVRCNYTARKLIKKAVGQLNITECKLLGTVLNRVSSSGMEYKYSKY